MGGEMPAEEVLLYAELNVLSFIVMLIIAVSALKLNATATRRTIMFVGSTLCAAVANVFDFIWNLGLTHSWNIPPEAMYAVDLCYFVSLGISSYCWLMYTEMVFSGGSIPKKVWLVAFVPFVAMVAIIVTSAFNGCAFYFDEAGMYHRGPLFYFQHMLSYGYIIYASLMCTLRAAISDSYVRKSEMKSLAMFIVPPVICAALQIAMQNLPILSVGIVISFLLVYIRVTRNMISEDELTGIANRKELFNYLSAQVDDLVPGDNLYLMFIDIDGFKQVNDTYGHVEGDRTLKALASALHQAAMHVGGFCARYGGDEFAFVVHCASESEAMHLKEDIRQRAASKGINENLMHGLSISIGCVRCEFGERNLQHLVQAADAAMYADKKR